MTTPNDRAQALGEQIKASLRSTWRGDGLDPAVDELVSLASARAEAPAGRQTAEQIKTFPTAQEFADAMQMAVTTEWLQGWDGCKSLAELRAAAPSPAAGALDALTAENERLGLYDLPSAAPSVGVQACRPEDRAMLQTQAGKELMTAAAAALAAPKAPDVETDVEEVMRAALQYAAARVEGHRCVSAEALEALRALVRRKVGRA
jgi:hypothetical protein